MAARGLIRRIEKLEQSWVEFLYDRVAQHLAGRSVELVWSAPYITDAQGMTHKNGDVAHIRIDPSLPDDEKFWVFLHEVSHAKLHLGLMGSSDHHQKPARSCRLVDPGAYKEFWSKMDAQADDQARIWMDCAESKAPGQSIAQKLIVLLECQ